MEQFGAMKLTVIMLNTQRTCITITCDNEWVPYGRRTVQIELTPEQLETLKPRHVGQNQGKDVYEEIGQVWLEESAHIELS